MRLAPGEKRPALNIANKLHPKKVMFLGAVAVPRPEHQFDGAIGFCPIGERTVAQRRS